VSEIERYGRTVVIAHGCPPASIRPKVTRMKKSKWCDKGVDALAATGPAVKKRKKRRRNSWRSFYIPPQRQNPNALSLARNRSDIKQQGLNFTDTRYRGYNRLFNHNYVSAYWSTEDNLVSFEVGLKWASSVLAVGRIEYGRTSYATQCTRHHELIVVWFSPRLHMAQYWKHMTHGTPAFSMSVFPVSCSNFDGELYCMLAPGIESGTGWYDYSSFERPTGSSGLPA
jgi:hypothetical protein